MVTQVHQLEFETLHNYGTHKTSIELDVTLSFWQAERLVPRPNRHWSYLLCF